MRHPHRAAHEAHVEALIAHSLAAVEADAAGLARIHRHPRAGLKLRHIVADGCDHARYLVSERHRLLDPDRAKTAMVIIVQIRTADAAGGDFDADFACARRRVGKAVDPQVFWGVDDDGLHGCSPSFVAGRAYIAASMPPST